jgi:hypothetical protein
LDDPEWTAEVGFGFQCKIRTKCGGWVNLCRSNSHAGVPQSFKWLDSRVAEQLQDVGYTVSLIVGTCPDVQCFSENCFFIGGGGGYGIRRIYQGGFVFTLYSILMSFMVI